MNLSLESSRVGDLYSHPLGRDIVDDLLLRLGRLDWPLDKLADARLKNLKQFAGRKVGPQFYTAVLDLLNHQPDAPYNEAVMPTPAWWKEAVFYRICPFTFTYDGLRGVIGKLDYLRELGINAVWIGPVYDSPGNNNGKDVRDYYSILPKLGTMRDMEILIWGLHSRGMKLVMDLAINHTSDEHKWFMDALHYENSPYRDFYFFRKGRGNSPPNNWTSVYGEPAWRYYAQQDIWALQLLDERQMDLNWDSPALRREIHRVLRWWLAKGVDGFSLDAINCISKYNGLPDGDELIGEVLMHTGTERYFYGPRLHEYLRELKAEMFMPYNALCMGEVQGIGPTAGRLLTDAYRGELDMIFSPTYDDYEHELMRLKYFYLEQLNTDAGHGWHPLILTDMAARAYLAK